MLVAPIRPAVVPMRPAAVPVRPVVVPMRPPVVPKRPAIIPRGPVKPIMPMGIAMPFRARPGMPNPGFVPMKPTIIQMRPGVVPMKPAIIPTRPTAPPKRLPVATGRVVPVPVVKPIPRVPMAVKPVPPGPKPLVNQMIQFPVYRARPVTKEETEFQEEEYAGEEEQYCECDEQAQEVQEEDAQNQLRARPIVSLMKPTAMRPPIAPIMRPTVKGPAAVKLVPVMAPRRGPAVYNTFQPRVFRARQRVMVRTTPVPMFTPLNTTFQPVVHGRGIGMKHHHLPLKAVPMGMGYAFRSKPRSSSYDAQDNQEYADCGTEGAEYNQTCVCSKCGKEF